MIRTALLLLLLAPASAGAYSSGAPADYVRIPWPSEALRSCTTCHTGVVNSFPGTLTLRAPVPAEYQPGARIPLGVDIVDPSPRLRWGFALAAVTSALAQAGSLNPIDATTSTVLESLRMVDFIRQSFVGSTVSSWDFDWIAPAAGSGDVTFYFCANAADGNGDVTNDHIFCTTATLNENRCDPLPRAIAGLAVVRDGTDLEWSWNVDADAAGGYRLYGVGTRAEIPNANRSTPAALRSCPAPTAATNQCREVGVAGDGLDVFYQLVGVCANGEEGPN